MDQLIVIVNNDGLIRELFIMMVRKSGFQISQKFGFPISQIFGFPYYSEICFSDLPDIQFSGKPNYPVFRFCRLSGKASLRPIHLSIAVTGYRYSNNWIFQNSTLIFTKISFFPFIMYMIPVNLSSSMIPSCFRYVRGGQEAAACADLRGAPTTALHPLSGHPHLSGRVATNG